MISWVLVLMMAGMQPAENPDCPQGSACFFGHEAVAAFDKADREEKRAEARFRLTIHDPKMVQKLGLEVELLQAMDQLLKSWRPAMEAECGVFGATVGGASPWKSAWKVQCKFDKLDERTLLLRKVIACVRKPVPADRSHDDPSECLYQLTPSIPAQDYQDAE